MAKVEVVLEWARFSRGGCKENSFVVIGSEVAGGLCFAVLIEVGTITE